MTHSPVPAIPYLFSFLMAPVLMVCVTERGRWTWMPLAVMFLGVPFLDAWIGMAEAARQSPDLDRNIYFKIVTWAWVPVQLGLLVWVLATTAFSGMTTSEIVGTTLSMGAVAGAIGFTFAHELVHRSHTAERALGETLLASVSYMHFAIEHVHGHHRHVGTPRDPATARLGESFYRFLPRTLIGSLISAWQLERERLERRRLHAWSASNRMLRYAATQIAIYAVVWSVFGWIGVAVFAGQAALAFSILEVINYVEHYGLTRKEIAPGEYERIAPQHSWDSASRVSNWMLINLARHSDHHCVTAKRYQSLELLPQAPQLPGGYGAMFLLALVPPLWFRVMNPLVGTTAASSAPSRAQSRRPAPR
jgi:alkane 1-monooxygenase